MIRTALALLVLSGAALAQPAHAAPTGEVVRVEHHDPDAPPTRGPLDAPVTIELFFVPAIQSTIYDRLEALQARHPSRIRIVYRLLKSNQTNLADAALEALAQGKFFEMMAALVDAHVHATLSRERILELGHDVGLDVGQLEAAMVEGRYADALNANDARHQRVHGMTVPDALFNGVRPRSGIGSMSMAALEEAYQDAYSRAIDLVDRGVDPSLLRDVFDAQVLAASPPPVLGGAATDDDLDHGQSTAAALADPPLDLRGLPAKGPANAAVPIVVLCHPASPLCFRMIDIMTKVQSIYPDDVRVVWAPWFDVERRDVARLSLLADATLCAETLGDGWDWLEQMKAELARRRGRQVPVERTMETIDTIAAVTQINRRALSRCEAEHAGDALARIGEARRAGIRVGPTIVIGGRIYAGGTDEKSVQALVEAELAPGVLGDLAPAAMHTPTAR